MPIHSFFPGWVREVIYKQGEDGTYLTSLPPDIVYHSPSSPGHKSKGFRSLSELSTYCKPWSDRLVNTGTVGITRIPFSVSKDSVFSWTHFSYRKEALGADAPPGQEVIRGENEKVDIVAEAKPPPQPQPLAAKGKRVNTKVRVKRALTPFNLQAT